jgi:hypothetical protein
MPKQKPTEADKKKALERARREFPDNEALQEIHYIRYLLEIEWKNMPMEEIQDEIRKAKRELGIGVG